MNARLLSLNALFTGLVLLAGAGCASAPPKAPVPPTDATRADFGQVALVSLASMPGFYANCRVTTIPTWVPVYESGAANSWKARSG